MTAGYLKKKKEQEHAILWETDFLLVSKNQLHGSAEVMPPRCTEEVLWWGQRNLEQPKGVLLHLMHKSNFNTYLPGLQPKRVLFSIMPWMNNIILLLAGLVIGL